mgnify:CR=1 FL=1
MMWWSGSILCWVGSGGVTSLLHACVEPSEIPAIRALADRFPEMRYSVGVHPLDTEHWTEDTQAVLRVDGAEVEQNTEITRLLY